MTWSGLFSYRPWLGLVFWEDFLPNLLILVRWSVWFLITSLVLLLITSLLLFLFTSSFLLFSSLLLLFVVNLIVFMHSFFEWLFPKRKFRFSLYLVLFVWSIIKSSWWIISTNSNIGLQSLTLLYLSGRDFYINFSWQHLACWLYKRSFVLYFFQKLVPFLEQHFITNMKDFPFDTSLNPLERI